MIEEYKAIHGAAPFGTTRARDEPPELAALYAAVRGRKDGSKSALFLSGGSRRR